MVEARDVSDYKVSFAAGKHSTYGAYQYQSREMDATIKKEDSIEQADVVICDAPCSGLGVVAGKPDIKYHMDAQKQKILQSCSGISWMWYALM